MISTLAYVLIALVLSIQPLFLAYFVLYNTYTLWLIALSAREVRRRVAGHFIEDLDLIDKADLTKPLTMIVPAYNEEVPIVDTVTGLINCDYPRFEIVVVNDGSSDLTLERLKTAFRLRRTDAPYRPAITTAPVRAMYRATIPLPAQVMQLIVIDKENGGKADALNAGINASTTPYFVSLDADSILDQRALKELMRVIQEDPRVVAVGGQVAIANGCTVRNSHVVKVGLPARSLPRFQMVEYLRSFTAARTGLDRMHAILILSGVFAVFEKDTVIRAGGYLTPYLRHRLVEEYVGTGSAPCAKTWRSSCGCTASSWTSCTTGALLSFPTRWPGPRSPKASNRSANSGGAGIADSASPCGITAPCFGSPNSAGSAGSRSRRSGCSSTTARWSRL